MPNDQPDWVSPTAQVQRELGSLTPPATQTLAQSFPVPTECQALGFLVDLKNGIFIPTNLTVQGDQTGLFYFNTTAPTGIINLEHRALADTSVTMTVQSPAAGPAKVRLLAYTGHPLVSVRNVSNTPLTVDVTDRAGRVLGDIVDRAARDLGIVRIKDTNGNLASVFIGASGFGELAVFEPDPRPWQAPALTVGFRTAGLGVGGSLTILTGSAGHNTLLHKMSLIIQAAAGSWGNIECPGGTVRAQWQGEASVAVPIDFGGVNCGPNAAAVINNQSGVNTGALAGHLTAIQP